MTDFANPRELITEWSEWLEKWDGQGNPDDDLIAEVHDELVNPHRENDKIINILAALYSWWLESNDVPVKLPNSLHVRSVLCLYKVGKLDADTLRIKS